MLRPIINYFLILFFISCGNGNNSANHINKNDLEKYDLKGHIKSIKVESFSLTNINDSINTLLDQSTNTINDSVVKIKTLLDYETYKLFNKDGNLLEFVEYDWKGNKVDSTRIKYDSKGKIKNKTQSETITKYEYTEFDSLININITAPNHSHRIAFIYNKKNRKIKRLEYKNDTLFEFTTYNYTKNGNEIETNNYDYKSRLNISLLRKYDSVNNLLKDTYIRIDSLKTGIGKYQHYYKYNEKSKLVLKTNLGVLDKASPYSKSIYEYYRNGILKSQIEKDSSRNFEQERIQIFDKKGNIIEHIWINEKKDTVLYHKDKYIYDNYGNWIKCTSPDSELKRENVIERKIEYY